MSSRSRDLTVAEIRSSLALSVAEGGFYAVMVGLGEAYFIADAVRLGASPLILALLVGLPLMMGGCAAFVAANLVHRVRSRRLATAALVIAQALVLLVASALEATGIMTPIALLVVVCVYQAFGQLCGVLWSSWYGDLVPPGIRGRYFARRSRVVHTVTFASLVGGGLVLHGSAPLGPEHDATAQGAAFSLLFGVAAAARIASALLLLASREPAASEEPPPSWTFLLDIRTPRSASRIVWIASSLSFAVYLGSPFFSPHMLGNLGLDYFAFMLASACQVAAKVIGLGIFGGAVDRAGAANVYRLAVALVALIPLPWLAIESLPSVLAIQAFSGFSWAAHEIGLFALLLESGARRERVRVFAAHSLLNGFGQFLGSMGGAAIVGLFGGAFSSAFAASLSARCAVAACLIIGVRQASRAAAPEEALALRVVGFRPSGGVAHRPVECPSDDSPTDAPEADHGPGNPA